MAKEDDDKPEDESSGEAGADAPKKGFVKKLLGNKKLLMIAVVTVELTAQPES